MCSKRNSRIQVKEREREREKVGFLRRGSRDDDDDSGGGGGFRRGMLNILPSK